MDGTGASGLKREKSGTQPASGVPKDTLLICFSSNKFYIIVSGFWFLKTLKIWHA